ncbi:50S ribosomal protein L13 [Candidatus Nitrospira neomarina]|uniref:Large ribosomal subunit protein uL13 n=1 Tax=Candidatus Nitrospira neomarina TaxID=3020899 RepID=A0AA96GK62_9BACT|nr:50S ribosomal protein L13 [Candidatus Nitrospira neomarina]WNM63954.1 50S ribosomal protein L13 [Candidatus Nitrospira neomarina]
MRSYQAKPLEVERQWFLVDAKGKTVGRLAAKVASILRGKHKPTFTPNVDTGDHVVIINSSKIQFTSDKFRRKIYYHHTGYPGGIKAITAEHLHAKKPTEVLTKAIRGMLPKCTLGKQMAKKLKIYPGAEHLHRAQSPTPLNL